MIVLCAVGHLRAGELDCDNNGVPDAEELSGHDCNANGVLDVCENDTLGGATTLSAGSSGVLGRPAFDLEGDVLVLGSPSASVNGLSRNGLVQIYRRVNGDWSLEQEIGGAESNTRFGGGVDISGDRIAIITATSSLSGGVNVYRYDSVGGQWVEEFDLRDLETGVTISTIWARVAIDGHCLVVSRNRSQRPTEFLFYELEGGAWTHKQTIYNASQVTTTGPGDFGLSQNVFAFYEEVPDPEFGGSSHLAIFEWNGYGWTRTARFLFYSDNLTSFIIGGLEVTSDRIVVAPKLQGAISFRRSESGWGHEATVNSLNLPLGYSYAGWSARRGDRFFLGGESNGEPTLMEILFDQAPPVLAPLESWTGRIARGGFVGGRYAYIEHAVDSTLYLLDINQDCDNDGVPDGCAIAGGAPDVDEDNVLDDCEVDCNQDGVPDDVQLAGGDCDHNGVLDECDIDPLDPDGDGVVSADCNENGIPDGCEDDCDGNGVPDDCDLNAADPDGDGQVADDCNANGVIDTCDIGRGVRELARLTPRAPWLTSQDRYGVSLAVEGELIVVAAQIDSSLAPNRVYVYRRTGGEWVEEAILTPDLSVIDFGYQVDIADGRIFIGEFDSVSPYEARVAVYERVSEGWVRTQSIVVAPSVSFAGRFDVLGDELLAFGPQTNVATLYRMTDGVWAPVNTFTNSFTRLGIALSEEFVAFGAIGGVYIYPRDESPNPGLSYYYRSVMPAQSPGASQPIAIVDDKVFVGHILSRADTSNSVVGAADVYGSFVDDSWSGVMRRWAPEAHFSKGVADGANQGWALAAHGNRCFVGFPSAASNVGVVRLYESDGAIWHERAVIASPLAPQPLQFGSTMAVSDRYLVVTAGVGTIPALSSFADTVVVYALDLDIDDNGVLDTCEADCDNNLYPDEGERTIDGFVRALLNGGAVCVFDMNDDGELSGLDVAPFVDLLITAP